MYTIIVSILSSSFWECLSAQNVLIWRKTIRDNDKEKSENWVDLMRGFHHIETVLRVFNFFAVDRQTSTIDF